MTWGKLLQPDIVLGETILALTPEILHQHNLKGLILDVDETLVPVSMTQASEELRQWIATIRSEVSIWLVSNNLSQTRISNIAQSLDLPFMLGARKPSRRKLRHAADMMQIPFEQVAMVGDRLFTDVLAGNRLGMFTILVEPMIDPSRLKKRYPIRDFEVWVSQLLGATLSSNSQ